MHVAIILLQVLQVSSWCTHPRHATHSVCILLRRCCFAGIRLVLQSIRSKLVHGCGARRGLCTDIAIAQGMLFCFALCFLWHLHSVVDGRLCWVYKGFPVCCGRRTAVCYRRGAAQGLGLRL